MITLDEAIKHCEEVADGMTEQGKCAECANEHRQLAGWLTELKQLREQTRWTPCSEQLPKENEYVGDMYVAHLSSVGWIPINSLKAISDEVIAWRPLPKPYKAEMESEE